MLIKCKMCGGDLHIEQGSTICECEYCGSKQTIPNTDDEKRLKLYERANKLRFNSEFDKAAGVYESIIADYQDEAEAYWGLVLCKYGIEYVDDPKTGKKIPTCHRSSFDCVLDDSNFELVMENADTVARGVYRNEAKQIEELRKGIIEVSSREEPYDIFICYKETADNGQRTIDSVIAQDIYEALVEKGYKVFFSRITLEDKLGQEYEPYIFAALNSAKVMLAFGTTYDYYNAVWVKNEWSRFLQLMESGQKKVLIPCYKNIDAYDMPKEFAKLQAQDMGKVGATQDLLRGIDKIFGRDRQSVNVSSVSTTAVLKGKSNSAKKRAELYLEDGEWEKAYQYYEHALDAAPDDAEIHLGKFLANCYCPNLETFLSRQINKLKSITPKKNQACEPNNELVDKIAKENNVSGYLSQAEIKDQFAYILTYDSYIDGLEREKEIYEDKDWKKVERFATGELLNFIQTIKKQNLEEIDKKIVQEKIKEVNQIEQISKDYAIFLEEKEKKIIEQRYKAEAKRESDYVSLCGKIDKADSENSLKNIINDFRKMEDYKESKEKIRISEAKLADIIYETKEKEKERRLAKKKKIKKIIIIASTVLLLIVACVVGYKVYQKKVVIPSQKYENAEKLMHEQKYEEAINAYSELGDYKDCSEKINECNSKIQQIEEQKKAAEEAAEKAAQEKELRDKIEAFQTSIDNNELEATVTSFYNLPDNIQLDYVDVIEDKIESIIDGNSSTLNEKHDWLYSFMDVLSEEKKQSLIEKCDDACMKQILKNGNSIVEFNYIKGDESMCFDFDINSILDLMSPEGKYKKTIETLRLIIDIVKDYSDGSDYATFEAGNVSIKVDTNNNLIFYAYFHNEATDRLSVNGHVFSVGSESIQIGKEELITYDLYKSGRITERTSPISGEWLELPID